MKIEMMAITSLRPYERNARTHSKGQIKKIAKSIERFGFCNPVLIDDNNEIIAGHGRVEAAKLLGMKEVPTVRLSHLSDSEKRAYVLADNRLAEKAGWDRQILAIELQGLIDLGFDIELTGFEPADVDLIIEEIGDDDDRDGDAIPSYDKGPAISELGDLWALGNHRLLCSDARNAEAYKLLMGDERAEFVFTDPPYNVPIDGHVCGLGRIRHEDFAMGCGEMDQQAFTAFLATVFEHMCRYSTDGSIYMICMDWRHMREMLRRRPRSLHGAEEHLIFWNKSNAGMGTFYRSQHEMVFPWKNGTAPHVNNFELGQHGRHRSNVWNYHGANAFRPGRLDELAMHPTVKPVLLVADAIKDCSRRGGMVRSLLRQRNDADRGRADRPACALPDRPHYVDVAIRRWEKYTGKTAALLPLGETFEGGARAADGNVRRLNLIHRRLRQSAQPRLSRNPSPPLASSLLSRHSMTRRTIRPGISDIKNLSDNVMNIQQPSNVGFGKPPKHTQFKKGQSEIRAVARRVALASTAFAVIYGTHLSRAHGYVQP